LETVDYVVDKFHIDLSQPSPFYLGIGRLKDVPRMFNELGFEIGAEVGVYTGYYSSWLFRMMPGLRLYGIDTWEAYPGSDFTADNLAKAYKLAQAAVEGQKSIFIKESSERAVEQFEDGSLDFVFIDADHSYEHTVWDIANWSKKVRKGGVVYGHDFDSGRGVVYAVEGWMKSYQIHPWFVLTGHRNKVWMYIKGELYA
jgi:predicted O-methyltransferase YrrM